MGIVKYSPNQVWLRSDTYDIATVGITPYAQEHLGDIVFIQLPSILQEIATEEEAAIIESVKAASALVMPVTGTIIEINSNLINEPSKANEDPFGEGWFFKIRLKQPNEIDQLMDEGTYLKFIRKI